MANTKLNNEKKPFFVLAKGEIIVAVNLLDSTAGDEIRQLQQEGFAIVTENCQAETSELAIDKYSKGFVWWNVWGSLNAIVAFVVAVNSAIEGDYLLSIALVLIFVGALMVLKKNKYAFLVMTVLSLNPVIWIINGIYLNERWDYPSLNR
ncbi:hypothetical protein [Aliagarivorans marinus]|uniref:hypothetical protein n=1 Tax=Aliagarivorans marinus TaxID=561965 RepID=UPI00040A8C96|nr:hypothetical protein [Aliagarivorans marinus]